MPAISVMIPIYNVEKYLEECFSSLVAQSFSDFEAICINDGSTDSSREIVQRFMDTDSRFKVIDKPNSGYGASMNQGLHAAQGEYIAILESDDKYEPFALEHLVNSARRHDADVVKADFDLYWSAPTERVEKFGITEGFPYEITVFPRQDTRIFYRKPSIWSALYRRDFLMNNDIIFLETPGASYQDAGFNFKVWASAERVVFLEESVLFYRQDNEQSSVNSPSKLFCVCDEYEEMQRWCDDDEGKRGWTEGIRERMKFDSYLWNYDRLSLKLQQEFLERAQKEFRADEAAGRIDYSLFEPWAEADLRALMESVERFRHCRDDFREPGKLNTFRHYYRLGGWALIGKVLASKIGSSNTGQGN